MERPLGADAINRLAPAGYYLALRVGFAFPREEQNALPPAWVEHYTRERLMLFDPVIRWLYQHSGAIRWSAIPVPDPRDVMGRARAHGLCFGVAIAVFDGNPEGERSFGSFARSDREFSDEEIARLEALVTARHLDLRPPPNLTRAEIEVLRMVGEGLRLKQIAWELGVTEGAVKQRLRNARIKLGAATGAQAASRARGLKLF